MTTTPPMKPDGDSSSLSPQAAPSDKLAKVAAELAGSLKELLNSAEIADCAPEDKDSETHDTERRARAAILAYQKATAGETRGKASTPSSPPKGPFTGWQPISTAPKDATWIVGRYRQKFGNFYYMMVHWADGGGEDQPRFRGWFSWSGGDGGFHQVDAPDDWQPRPDSPSSPPDAVLELVEALEKARDQFRFYERRHREKYGAYDPRCDGPEPPKGRLAKAETNKKFADMLDAALSRYRGRKA